MSESLPLATVGDSRFINHPDFGDVYKTTYKKGTITDFEVIEEDPFTVTPRVKVTGDWGESDYIPLFYRPKAQYWDTDDHEATEFNKDSQYYENAWMSFRGDDEVVVLLREGTPTAVVGFYDGVPRIGEHVVKLTTEGGYSDCYREVPTLELYSSKSDADYGLGPDGTALNLLKKVDKFTGPENSITRSVKYHILAYPNESLLLPWGTVVPGYEETDLAYTKNFLDDYYKFNLWMARVGPLLVVIVVALQAGVSHADYYYARPFDANFPDWYTEYEGQQVINWCAPGILTGEGHTDNNLWWLQLENDDTIAPGWVGHKWEIGPDGRNLSEESEKVWEPMGELIKVGLYSDELYQETLDYFNGLDPVAIYEANPDQIFIIDGVEYSGRLNYHDWLPDAPKELKFQEQADLLLRMFSLDIQDIYIRPHTKEELQAAGLWPS